MIKIVYIKKIFFLHLIAVNLGYAQNFETIKLLNETDSTGIEFAYIFLDEKLVTYSDESGDFKIDVHRHFDTLTIKHLSYNTKEITKNDLRKIDSVFMREKENLLDEVIISNKKNRKEYLLLPEKSMKEFFMKGLDVRFPYNFMNAVYVPNEFKKGEHKIVSIVFESRKGHEYPDAKFIPFKVNLMTVDTVSYLPKIKIFDEDLAVGKKENQKLLKVDISEYDIELPKEGIFVVVSLYDKEYYESNGFTERPGFGQTQITKNSKFFELFWIPNKGVWEEPFYSQERIQCRNFGVEAIEN